MHCFESAGPWNCPCGARATCRTASVGFVPFMQQSSYAPWQHAASKFLRPLHALVAQQLEVLLCVVHVSNATAHTSPKVLAGLAQDHCHTACRVSEQLCVCTSVCMCTCVSFEVTQPYHQEGRLKHPPLLPPGQGTAWL